MQDPAWRKSLAASTRGRDLPDARVEGKFHTFRVVTFDAHDRMSLNNSMPLSMTPWRDKGTKRPKTSTEAPRFSRDCFNGNFPSRALSGTGLVSRSLFLLESLVAKLAIVRLVTPLLSIVRDDNSQMQ